MTIISKDLLWKGIIEDLFDHFLIYFYPNATEIFDFSKGFEFLDKELEQIIIPSESKNRIADKLVKVFTKEGVEQWILVHIEVQGYEDDSFPLRMFTYYYRIFDKYQRPITAIALFTDDTPTYRPNTYQTSFLDTSIVYSYGTYKLSDYQPSDFQKIDNPFAIMMETAWYGLRTNKLSDENLFLLKLDLARRLSKKGYPKETFLKMCSFIKSYVSFGNKKLLPKLVEEIDTINQITKPMGILETIEQEIIRQTTEDVKKQTTEEVKKQTTEEVTKDNIKKLYRKGFSIDVIAETLELSIAFVEQAIAE
jgi:Putative transposase, YhgA-like